MKKENEVQQLSASELIARAFGMIMVVLYLAIGTTIVIKARDISDVPTPYVLIFGIFLIFYGVLRAYKLYRRITSPPQEE